MIDKSDMEEIISLLQEPYQDYRISRGGRCLLWADGKWRVYAKRRLVWTACIYVGDSLKEAIEVLKKDG
jgi:hypothetical protein